MDTKTTHTMPHRNVPKRLSVWAGVVVAVLMIPLIANVPWTGSDFVFAGTVLFALAIIYELATRNMSSIAHRAAVGFGVLVTIFLIMGWAASGP